MEKIITIKPNVYFVSDLGYLFFDNGIKTIRLTNDNFSQALNRIEIAETLIFNNPDFFEFVENNSLAEERLKDGRITF